MYLIHLKGSDAILLFSKLLLHLVSSSHTLFFPQGHLFLRFTLSCLPSLLLHCSFLSDYKHLPIFNKQMKQNSSLRATNE